MSRSVGPEETQHSSFRGAVERGGGGGHQASHGGHLHYQASPPSPLHRHLLHGEVGSVHDPQQVDVDDVGVGGLVGLVDAGIVAEDLHLPTEESLSPEPDLAPLGAVRDVVLTEGEPGGAVVRLQLSPGQLPPLTADVCEEDPATTG